MVFSHINQNGIWNSNEIPSYQEALDMIRLVRPLSDEKTIMVEETPGGSMLSSLSAVGGLAESETKALGNHDFLVTQESVNEFKIGTGGLVVGDQLFIIEESTPFGTGGPSAFINLKVFYNYTTSQYVFGWIGSTSFPLQNKSAGTGGFYYAERFPLAYITTDGSGNIQQIDQLNSKEIRTHRIN